jgi:hypothetical protein
MKIAIADLKLDIDIYPRNGLSETNIHRLLDAYNAGSKFPPIVIEAKTNRVVDGWHRVEMHKRLKNKQIEAIKKSYDNDGDLYADAVRLNVSHGQPLDQFSIRRAVIRLEAYGFTRESIADVIRVPLPQIDKIERGFAHNERGGPIAVKGGLSHLRGRILSERQQQINKRYSGPKAAFLVRQLREILENELWPDKSLTFAEEMDKIVGLWAAITKARSAA